MLHPPCTELIPYFPELLQSDSSADLSCFSGRRSALDLCNAGAMRISCPFKFHFFSYYLIYPLRPCQIYEALSCSVFRQKPRSLHFTIMNSLSSEWDATQVSVGALCVAFLFPVHEISKLYTGYCLVFISWLKRFSSIRMSSKKLSWVSERLWQQYLNDVQPVRISYVHRTSHRRSSVLTSFSGGKKHWVDASFDASSAWYLLFYWSQWVLLVPSSIRSNWNCSAFFSLDGKWKWKACRSEQKRRRVSMLWIIDLL